MVEKWDPFTGNQGLRDLRDHPGPPGPRRTTCIFWDLQDHLQSPGHLETSRSPWDFKNLSGTTGISRYVMREKYFSGMISFLYLKNYNFSITKIYQF